MEGFERRESRAQAERVAALGPPRLGAFAPGEGVEMAPGDAVGDEALEEQAPR